jgi:hypothetical protein
VKRAAQAKYDRAMRNETKRRGKTKELARRARLIYEIADAVCNPIFGLAGDLPAGSGVGTN